MCVCVCVCVCMCVCVCVYMCLSQARLLFIIHSWILTHVHLAGASFRALLYNSDMQIHLHVCCSCGMEVRIQRDMYVQNKEQTEDGQVS